MLRSALGKEGFQEFRCFDLQTQNAVAVAAAMKLALQGERNEDAKDLGDAELNVEEGVCEQALERVEQQEVGQNVALWLVLDHLNLKLVS